MKVKTLFIILLLVVIMIADINFCIKYGNPFGYMKSSNFYSSCVIASILASGATVIALLLHRITDLEIWDKKINFRHNKK